MVLKYRLLEKGEPGVADGGTKKWYACVITDAEVSIDGLVKSIEKFSALSEADIRGVIIALENVIQATLADSKTVLSLTRNFENSDSVLNAVGVVKV